MAILKVKRLLKAYKSLNYFYSTSTVIKPNLSTSVPWIPVIGLEIHAQIACSSKLFSGASTDNFAPLNSVVSYLDCALPGTLPVLNRKCVEAAVLTALALKCKLNYMSRFDRKHYFYADLPAGYQITQLHQPIAKNGSLSYYVYDLDKKAEAAEPYEKTTKVLQLQLEQDSGKSLTDTVKNRTYIDLNRAGCGLMEIVFDHNLTSSLEAVGLIKELVSILRTLGACGCKMDKGQFRVDANISVHKSGEPLGTRTEVKNLNSVRFVQWALDFEIQRQIRILEEGGEIINETRTFDYRTGITTSMRDKEVRQDYRYMPEPNLPPLNLYSKSKPPPPDLDPLSVIDVDKISETMPVLQRETRKQWLTVYKIPLKTIFAIEEGKSAIDFLSMCLLHDFDEKHLLALQVIDLQRWLDKQKRDFCNRGNIEPENFVKICQLYKNASLTTENFYKVLKFYLDGEKREPSLLIGEKNLLTITDWEVIEKTCDEILAADPEAVKVYKKGTTKVLKKFIRLASEKLEDRVSVEDLASCFVKKLS